MLYLLCHLRVDVLKHLPLEVCAPATKSLLSLLCGQSRRHMQKIKSGVVLGREHGCTGDSACRAVREICRH
jgi:hypothetical protein